MMGNNTVGQNRFSRGFWFLFKTLDNKIENRKSYVWSAGTRRLGSIMAYRAVTGVGDSSSAASDEVWSTSARRTEIVLWT